MSAEADTLKSTTLKTSDFCDCDEQAGIVHQAVIVDGDLDAVEVVAWSHLLGAPSLGSGCRYKTIIPDSEEHLLAALER